MFGLIAAAVAFGYAASSNPLLWDEYYHLLAGRSWAATGTFQVGDGIYARAPLVSMVVGWLNRAFGEDVLLPKVLFALAPSAWAVTVFYWTRSVAGRFGAWIAALGLLANPWFIETAGMVRFYGVLGLLFFLGTATLYHALTGKQPHRSRVLLLAISVGLLTVCYRLSPLAAPALAGVGLWVVGVAANLAVRSPKRSLLLFGLSVVVLGAVGSVLASGLLSSFVELGSEVPGWASRNAEDPAYYLRLLWQTHPVPFVLFPIALALAIRRNAAASLLCVSVFGLSVGIQSFAGAKSTRYLVVSLPYFFALWGLAAGSLAPWLMRRARALPPGHAAGTGPGNYGSPRMIKTVAALLVWLVVCAPGSFRAVRLLRGVEKAASLAPADWDAIAPALRELTSQVEVVLTPNTLQSLYHVGDYDYDLRPSVINMLDPPRDFGIDRRTGRAGISTLESFLTVRDRHPTGLVFGERWRFRAALAGIAPDVWRYLERNTERVVLSEDGRVVVYRWPKGTSD